MKRNLFLQLIIFCFVLFLGAKVCGASVSKVDAKAWVNDKGRELLDTFNEPNLAEKYRRLDKLFVEYVDLDYISKFVVGKYWRQMSPEQQKRYQEIFKRYALGVYKGFPLSFEQKINFEVNSVQSEKDYTDVTTSIVLEEKKDNQQPQTFLVVFRLVEVEGGYKIIDLLSQALTNLFVPQGATVLGLQDTVSSKFAFVDTAKVSDLSFVFFFDILVAPFAKLEDKITGSKSGVIPIAIATANVNAVMVPCFAAFTIKVIGISTSINLISSLLTFSIPF